MKIISLIGTALVLLASATLSAECVIPEVPTIPDGSTSDEDTFMAGYQQGRAYITEGDAYLKCLEAEEAAEIEAGVATDESKAERLALYNAVVDSMQNVGNTLNSEVREYKAAHPQ
jgi:hypothetical protein